MYVIRYSVGQMPDERDAYEYRRVSAADESTVEWIAEAVGHCVDLQTIAEAKGAPMKEIISFSRILDALSDARTSIEEWKTLPAFADVDDEISCHFHGERIKSESYQVHYKIEIYDNEKDEWDLVWMETDNDTAASSADRLTKAVRKYEAYMIVNDEFYRLSCPNPLAIG
jgi:hypothetical protein